MTKQAEMEQLIATITRCRKCRLCEHALNAVPGSGNIDTEIVFIGEAPGQTEDQTGLPFVGRAGKLLDTLLGTINMKREDIWIGNIIKHRPPENRDPLPDELAACSPYLHKQLEIIKPVLVVTLGRFSMNYFYEQGKISLDHGRLIKVGKHNVFPLYHPAAALRNPTMDRALRADFLRIPEVLAQAKHSDKVNEQKVDVTDGQLGLFE